MTTTFKSLIDYPGAVPTLNANINDAVTTIVLAAGTGAYLPAANFWVTIDSEQILVATRATDTLTCTGGRGANGSVAAAHSSGTSVFCYITKTHYDNLGTAINNLEDGTTPAAKATILATARAINGVDFNGSAPITVPVNNANDTTTNASFFLLFTSTKDGNYAAKVADSKLFFNPSTGLLTATGFSGPLNGPLGSVTPNTVKGTTGEFSSAITSGADAAGAASLVLNAAAGTYRGVFWKTAGVNRWRFATDTDAESGANAGCTLKLVSYDDAGSAIKTPISITRATGDITFGSNATMTLNLTASGGGITAGVAATTRGVFTARRGTDTDKPGCVSLISKGGTQYWIWAEDDGTLRIHNALPTADTDGSMVGTQT